MDNWTVKDQALADRIDRIERSMRLHSGATRIKRCLQRKWERCPEQGPENPNEPF